MLRSCTTQRLDNLDERLNALEQCRARPHSHEGSDADDEGNGKPVKKTKKRKGGKAAAANILSVSLDELTMEQKETRLALHVRCPLY